MTEVDATRRIVGCRRAANDRTGARRWAVGIRPYLVGKRLPIERIQGVVVLELLVAAERAARQLELEDIVEDAPGAERLPAPIAENVVGRAKARRNFVGEVELHAELRNIGARGVSRHTFPLG